MCDAELRCFFDDEVHAFVGRNADEKGHSNGGFAFNRLVCANLGLYLVFFDGCDGGQELTALAIEQVKVVFGLHAQDLDVASRIRR